MIREHPTPSGEDAQNRHIPTRPGHLNRQRAALGGPDPLEHDDFGGGADIWSDCFRAAPNAGFIRETPARQSCRGNRGLMMRHPLLPIGLTALLGFSTTAPVQGQARDP